MYVCNGPVHCGMSVVFLVVFAMFFSAQLVKHGYTDIFQMKLGQPVNWTLRTLKDVWNQIKIYVYCCNGHYQLSPVQLTATTNQPFSVYSRPALCQQVN